MINVYVTHHVRRELDGINDILIDQLLRMRQDGIASKARLCVVYWTNDDVFSDDLRRRLPSGIELVFNDRDGRPDIQPSLRNKVVEHARASGCEAFVLLHNDVRLARGWLDRIVADWHMAEAKWGEGSSIISPRFIPYHLTTPHPEAVTNERFWADLRENVNIKTAAAMAQWCKPWSFPFVGGEVGCPAPTLTPRFTDDGHQLMMFMAGSRFFDDVGLCDEHYSGVNYDDSDWGIRALLAGKRNLQSTGALVGHIAGLSFGTAGKAPGAFIRDTSDNEKVFVAKWGQAIFDEMQTGQIWIRLHREQGP